MRSRSNRRPIALSNIEARCILVMLALRVKKDKDWSCRPSLDTIAADCATSVATVRRRLEVLEAADLIARRKRYNQTDTIYVNVPLIRSLHLSQKMREVQESASPYTVAAEEYYNGGRP